MKRRQFLQAAGLAAAATAVATPAIAQSMPELKWRLTSSFPKSLDTIYGAAEVFAKAVAESDRQQIPDPGLRRRRDRARPCRRRRRAERHRRDVPHRVLLLLRQGSDLRVRHRACRSGSTRRQQNAWMYFGGGIELINDFYKKYNIYGIPGRQHRLPDGRLVPQGDQDGRRPQRASRCASAASPARVLAKLGVVPQQIAGGDIYPALEKGTIDAAEWVGPYDDEKLGFHKVAPVLLLSRLVGRRGDAAQLHQHREVERAAAGLPVAGAHGVRGGRTTGCWRSTTPSIRRRSSAWSPPAPSCARSRPAIMEACSRRRNEVYAEISARPTRLQEGCTTAMIAFRGDQYLWWQVAEYTYDTFMIRMRTSDADRADVSGVQRRYASGPSRLRRVFCWVA